MKYGSSLCGISWNSHSAEVLIYFVICQLSEASIALDTLVASEVIDITISLLVALSFKIK